MPPCSNNWKKACWPLVPGSPHTTGQVDIATGWPSRVTDLPLLHLELLQAGMRASACEYGAIHAGGMKEGAVPHPSRARIAGMLASSGASAK